ncbi:MAG: M23 family metallopeptidase [Gammaproteobacteria bacterium]|nr:M23 family metallopeptidase [Gammaproteobacteria bacterium]MDH3767116.1 M23 family metallopeptidase [Gammaproteobacteria bacterium]
MKTGRAIGLPLSIVLATACGGGGAGATPVIAQSFCADALFPDPSTSPYVLPYPPNVSYTMFQGNCSQLGGHRDTFAYDFSHGMGDPITASRAGTVIIVNDNFSDDDHIEGHENNVFVEHTDGTVVRYTHLMQDGAMVTVDQQVFQGDIVSLAGNSGNSSGPHLHFQVFRSRNFDKSNAIPVTFRNAIGTARTNGELIEGQVYQADSF